MAKPSNPSPKKQKVEEAPAAVNGDAKTNGTTGSQLDQLKAHTVVVADTGDIESIKLYKPTDATTNPSLILASASNAAYKHLIDEAVKFSKEHFAEYSLDHFAKASRGRKKSGTKVAEATPEELLSLALDKVAVNFGCEILKTVSGVVSTEVDARLSFDVETSVLRAKRIIKLYEDAGVEKERILIKLASTWEGFLAAKELKKLDIKCNLTLLFSFYQAVAAAEAGVELISPFVGRIRDWYMTNEPSLDISKAENDPGCVSVKKIYNYYKKFGYDTIVMGASFRTKDEILELAGCDKLTIAPKLLQELQNSTESVILKLSKEKVESEVSEKVHLEEKDFRWFMNEDKMATDKLAEGIRNFAKDIEKLEAIIKPML